jgi:hypothetical protein
MVITKPLMMITNGSDHITFLNLHVADVAQQLEVWRSNSLA